MFWNLFKKELKFYLYSPASYVFAFLLVGICTWLFFNDFFVIDQAEVEPLLSTLGFMLALFVPAFCMGSLADEKKNGTLEVLLTNPVSEFKLVLAKFFAATVSVWIFILSTFPVVVLTFLLGKPDAGVMFSGYLGLFLLSAVYCAVGIFASSLTNSSIVAFLIASVILIVDSIVGQEGILSRFPNSIAKIISLLSWNSYMPELNAGLVRLSSAVVLISSVIIFLTLAIANLKSRNA